MNTNQEIGFRIKERRNELGLTLQEIADIIGVDRSTIQRYEQGLIKTIKLPVIQEIARALRVNPNWLIGKDVSKYPMDYSSLSELRPITLKKFPLLGEIACGKPIFANESHEAYIDACTDIKADFCLVAKGDSMVGARIHDGDVVFIKEQPLVDNGQIAAVIINNEVTLKRWYFYAEKQKLVLNPENTAYEPLVYIGEELNDIRCIGRAICFMSNL